MKLRLKSPSDPQFLLRVEPDANDTGSQFKSFLRHEVFKGEGPPESDYKLSINKKTSTTASAQPATAASNHQPIEVQAPPDSVSPPPSKIMKPHEEDYEDMDVDVQLPTQQGPKAPDYLLRILGCAAPVKLAEEALLAAAVHAAMLESGFSVQETSILDAMPGPVFKQSYFVPQLAPALAQAAAPSLTEAAAPGQQPVTCVLRCVGMGSVLVVHGGVLLGSRPAAIRTLKLQMVEHVRAAAGQQPPAAGSDVDGPAGLPQGGGASTSEPSVVDAGPDPLSCFADVKRLWTLVKDGLSLPLLAAMYHAAGLEAPLSLLTLPFELKQRVLGNLQARELAALSCSCSELRHLASADDLWRPLYRREFPSAPPSDMQEAQHNGWKLGFTRAWLRRKAVAEQRRNRSMLRPMRFSPFPGPLPGPPAPSSTRIPGITGGDYDRFPEPFLGRGPGMFPGHHFGGGPGLGPAGGPMFPGMGHRGGSSRGNFRLG